MPSASYRNQSGNPSPTANANPPIDFDTSVPHCTPTHQRPQALDIDKVISKPSIARANRAVSTSQPDGSAQSSSESFRDYVRPHSLTFPHAFNVIRRPIGLSFVNMAVDGAD